MILGIDASTYLEELDHGAKFYDGEREIDPLDAFMANGVDYMRIRLWNDPFDDSDEPYLAGNCDFSNYVKLASLAKSKGYRILLDFHYSDFWADPGKQFIPKCWRGLDLDQLCQAVYTFTKQVLEDARERGLSPDMIQVGNEITNGILWPIGKLEIDGKRGNYDAFCALIDAGCRACREISPEAKIMLHLERSNYAQVYQEFFAEMEKHGIDYDIIGASYYPYWHGTPDQLFQNLNACRRFGKEIMIAELGYGFTDKGYVIDGEQRRLVIDAERAFVPGVSDQFPLTPTGQAEYVEYILRLARENNIDGVFYWEPLWIPGEGICWASEAGQEYIGETGKSTLNEWANQCLFDYEGKKLPAFDCFK
jgi:arabinogalactan endo-1,4-beta-galactosidase